MVNIWYTEKGTGPTKDWPNTPKVGDRVVIREGCFAGEEGIVTKIWTDKMRFWGETAPHWFVVLDNGKMVAFTVGMLWPAGVADKARERAKELSVT